VLLYCTYAEVLTAITKHSLTTASLRHACTIQDGPKAIAVILKRLNDLHAVWHVHFIYCSESLLLLLLLLLTTVFILP